MLCFNCKGLTSLDISNFDTSKVTDMRNIFSGCKKFTKITVSNKWIVGSSVRTDDMFTNCGVDHVTVV
jgi:surface protein